MTIIFLMLNLAFMSKIWKKWPKMTIRKIKSLYPKEINVWAFMASNQFKNFKRLDNISIFDWINEFECWNNRINHFDMDLHTSLLAYKVLNTYRLPYYIETHKTTANAYDWWIMNLPKYEKTIKNNYDGSGSSLKFSRKIRAMLVNQVSVT